MLSLEKTPQSCSLFPFKTKILYNSIKTAATAALMLHWPSFTRSMLLLFPLCLPSSCIRLGMNADWFWTSSCFAKLTGRRGKGTLKMRTEDVTIFFKKSRRGKKKQRVNACDQRIRRRKCGKEEETMRKDRRRIRSRSGGGTEGV